VTLRLRFANGINNTCSIESPVRCKGDQLRRNVSGPSERWISLRRSDDGARGFVGWTDHSLSRWWDWLGTTRLWVLRGRCLFRRL